MGGNIIAKISKSKDNVVIIKSSKINVLFDGKRVKMEGSKLLKNKLCGLCGDSNNKKVGDVPSPRQCLLSSSGRGLSECPNPRPVNCIAVWQPVCGADGRTHSNECVAVHQCETEVACQGVCPCPTSSIRS